MGCFCGGMWVCGCMHWEWGMDGAGSLALPCTWSLPLLTPAPYSHPGPIAHPAPACPLLPQQPAQSPWSPRAAAGLVIVKVSPLLAPAALRPAPSWHSFPVSWCHHVAISHLQCNLPVILGGLGKAETASDPGGVQQVDGSPTNTAGLSGRVTGLLGTWGRLNCGENQGSLFSRP